MCVVLTNCTLRCCLKILLKILGIVCFGSVALRGNYVTAQIIPDATLPNNSSVQSINSSKVISGGTQVGSNLFHSFEEFSIPNGQGAYFNHNLDIQNIIGRVTGSKVSNIDGVITANGTANLFFINPNGIVFGNNSELNIGGSFIASTANSLNFADGSEFSATNTKPPALLTVSVPIGLQFEKFANPIRLESQAGRDNATNSFGFPGGLKVSVGKTLAFVGGDVILSGGNLTAPEGRIELLSVGSNSQVSLQPTLASWVVEPKDVGSFQDIKFLERTGIPSVVDASGEGSGTIGVLGKNVLIDGASTIVNITLGSRSGGNLSVVAKESLELVGNGTPLVTGTDSVGDAGALTLTAKNLVVRNGAQVLSYSSADGQGGQLIVNASDSVKIIDGYSFVYPITNSNVFVPSTIASLAYANGNAGDIEVNTGRLYVQGGARISTQSLGSFLSSSNQYIPATRQGANLTVNARDSIELIGVDKHSSTVGGLFASTQGSGNAGDLKLNTGQLVVRNGTVVSVSSKVENFLFYESIDISSLGSSGNLEVKANSIILDNQGKLIAETDFGKGGNINLQVQNLLNLRSLGQISTSAGRAQAIGDGGNITINAPNGFIVAKKRGNSDITANAFSGSGGNIYINAAGIFGIVPRGREELTKVFGSDPLKIDPQGLPTSDITAISQQNPTLNGQINISTFDVDPNRGLSRLPIETSELKLAQSCISQTGIRGNKFTIVGRQGLPVDPRGFLRNENIYADWIALPGSNSTSVEANRLSIQRKVTSASLDKLKINSPTRVIEAKGWVVDNNKNVVLVAEAPALAQRNSLFNQMDCVTY
ncbi:MAG: filamentous hemagglutinin N-terminal domain-containing protein [Calothrix sp. C42_A2020_038]|nr:filamentous hemagglutinin N-terminal domain-containing protein [Calothrix sp. C42_A2020_038]